MRSSTPSSHGLESNQPSSGRKPSRSRPSATRSRWAGLSHFLDDGRIEIDANVIERTIRRNLRT
ncbi:IS66 family transposase [Mesorhizobium sp. Cs1299R1N3]|uniref:IS66 family transposase n=1 Tax=Mesorhizobium sp. Cs1299R1N3 TaxID=3015173 RepID=UPI003FA5AE9C